jgi:hypothetical protein
MRDPDPVRHSFHEMRRPPRGSIEQVEAQRARWGHHRARLNLEAPSDPNFASGGIPGTTEGPFLRLVILPTDPESVAIDLDEDLWAWWVAEYDDPASQTITQWGTTKRLNHLGVFRGTQFRDDQWARYISLSRCLALDMGLMSDATYYLPSYEAHVFRLVPAVARVWSALHRYGAVLQQFAAGKTLGPWEVTLALRDTKGAMLGHVAKGWAEPGMGFRPAPCTDEGLLMRLEIPDIWPDDDGIRDVAYRFGLLMENSFGFDVRRWIVNVPDNRVFDKEAARWG